MEFDLNKNLDFDLNENPVSECEGIENFVMSRDSFVSALPFIRSRLSTLESVESVRRSGGSGGSRQTIPHRRVRDKCDRKQNALSHAIKILGEDTIRKIREDWASMRTTRNETEWQQSKGILMHILQRGLSQRVIRAVIPCGGSKLHRIQAAMKNVIESFHTRRPPCVPHHALSEDDLNRLKEDAKLWEVEDGFPCSHRRLRQYLVEGETTWIVLHERYKEKMKRENHRVISLSRWRQYVHFYFLGLHLSRSVEDLCDCCVRLDIQLQREDLSPEDKKRLILEKSTHLTAAIEQRRTVSNFVKLLLKESAPHQEIPSVLLTDHYDEEGPSEPIAWPLLNEEPLVQIQVEDFGGSFSMPYYGHLRPSTDYFNSNLMIHNFVVADLSRGVNNVMFYDERAKGKDIDALCSLRFVYQIELLRRNQGRRANTLVLILDNCVGQNKSQVVFRFFALFSELFYKKVVLIYLLLGHSHNQADKMVAWCRKAMKGKNFYTPKGIVDAVNEVKSVQAEFIDHCHPQRPLFEGWDMLLKKHFGPMPSRYTNNYFFEIHSELVNMQHLSSSPDAEVTLVPLIPQGNVDLVRCLVLQEMFGPTVYSIEQAKLSLIKLPRAPLRSLSDKKLISLSKKYFSIPTKHQHYYPTGSAPNSYVQIDASIGSIPEEQEDRATRDRVDLPSLTSTAHPRAKPGRPKKVVVPIAIASKSILSFFAKHPALPKD